jgi:orotidine-5'-phosphate decarboxylase
MMKAAAEAASGSALKVVGVTLLTSVSEKDFSSVQRCWTGKLIDQTVDRPMVVYSMAELASKAGLHGLVCSVPDLHQQGNQLRQLKWPASPIFITPGIRRAGDQAGDQFSIATPELAVSSGSTHLVVGRPVTSSSNLSPEAAALIFIEAIENTADGNFS